MPSEGGAPRTRKRAWFVAVLPSATKMAQIAPETERGDSFSLCREQRNADVAAVVVSGRSALHPTQGRSGTSLCSSARATSISCHHHCLHRHHPPHTPSSPILRIYQEIQRSLRDQKCPKRQIRRMPKKAAPKPLVALAGKQTRTAELRK